MDSKPTGWACLTTLVFLSSGFAAERVRVPEATPVHVKLKTDLKGDQAQQGQRVDFEVAQPVAIDGRVAIPQGAAAWGAVQSVKKKEIKFDIEGIKLASQVEVKLRTTADKLKDTSKDVIKVEAGTAPAVLGRLKGLGKSSDTKADNVAAAVQGTEYVAYVDREVDLEAVPSGAGSRPSGSPAAATVVPSSPAARPGAPAIVTAPASPPSGGDTPAAIRAPQPATPNPRPVPTNVERVTVECYSDPMGADILIDGKFVGNTPSILKVPVGSHQLEFQFRDHKTARQSLDLAPGAGMRTIRAPLERIQ